MKKFLCLLMALLLFISASSASEQQDFLSYIKQRFAYFQNRQDEYHENYLYQTESEKEQAFEELYAAYIDYYTDITQYYIDNVKTPFDYKYVKKHKNEYKKYGLRFNNPEGNWDIEVDYSMLLRTSKIPKVWLKWLSLQQKCVVKNKKREGGSMTNLDMERIIIALSKTELKSERIASIESKDFDYIPQTSRELISTYLMGNDLRPVFEWGENDSRFLNKESQKSFEHFIKHYKHSEYWNVVNEYYNKLKQNNFMYSPRITAWLIDTLENPTNKTFEYRLKQTK